jgi:Aminoglycoside-2''-adenylyltransferase
VDDAEFFGWYGPWSPIGVRDVRMLLSGLDAPWWIVGGHAIERFTGVSRHHDDIDVAVRRSDAAHLLKVLAREYHAWANASGTLTPMIDGRLDLPADAGQIWVRRDASSPREVDFVIAEERDGKWVWRHDPTVTIAYDDLVWADADGVRFARPEIVLAHKAKWRQTKDDLDFRTTWPLLDTPARSWLQTTLTSMYPDHPWLSHMT